MSAVDAGARLRANLDRLRGNESIAARFWEKVEMGLSTRCWMWKAHIIKPFGHGGFRISKNPRIQLRAHQVAFWLTHGWLPEVVRHKCDVPACVNPNHLIAGTHLSNVADRVKRGRSATGERNGRSKLTVEQVRKIRRSTQPMWALGQTYGVSPRTIEKILNGETWRHVL